MGAAGGVRQGAAQGVVGYTPGGGGIGKGEREGEAEWLGSAKSKVGWGFLVGLVRECTTGFSSRWPAPHG